MASLADLLNGIRRHGLQDEKRMRPAFPAEHVRLYDGICALEEDDSVLMLTLAPHEQGYGGYTTWLTGDLSRRDAVAVSFIGVVPADFQLGIGYIHNPDPLYSNHFHVLSDINIDPESDAEIRVGPPGPGRFASVSPKRVALFDGPGLDPGDKIGFATDGVEVCFFQNDGTGTPLEKTVRINNTHGKPLRAFFSCYIEEPVVFSMRAEDPPATTATVKKLASN